MVFAYRFTVTGTPTFHWIITTKKGKKGHQWSEKKAPLIHVCALPGKVGGGETLSKSVPEHGGGKFAKFRTGDGDQFNKIAQSPLSFVCIFLMKFGRKFPKQSNTFGIALYLLKLSDEQGFSIIIHPQIYIPNNQVIGRIIWPNCSLFTRQIFVTRQ